MKFTEGMWKVREGVTCNWMENVERVSIQDSHADLLLTKYTRGRGDKLNSAVISAAIRSPAEGMIAAKFSHWDGAIDHGPHFELSQDSSVVEFDHDQGKNLNASAGSLHANINTALNKFAVKYKFEDTLLTGHSWRSIALVEDQNVPHYNPKDELYAQKDHYILLELDLSVNEKIYGLGERFGPFIKNGQSVDLWNEDGGTSSELAYKNVPLYISSRGYGVFINDPGRVMLEIQSERSTRVNIAVKGESLEYMIIAGPTIKDILRRYVALTGQPSLPPAWSYGLWLTTSFLTSYDEKTVSSFLDGLRDKDISLSVFHFDAYWMKSYSWCDFEFDNDYFPDVNKYVQRLKVDDYRVKLCVWLNSYVAQQSKLFAEGKENGYFIMRADTTSPTVWQTNLWQPGMAIVDFTNPEARKWFASHLWKLMDMGIDSFKTDFGERIPFDPRIVKYYDGSNPVKMHNYYTYLYNKCVWETMEGYAKTHPERKLDPCLFARSATTGGQKYPVHWSGDCESTFPAMAETLRGGLGLALSGFAFWAHDIGGFEGLPPPALYKRWVQFGLLCSHSRLHGSSSYRVPWIYADHPELGGQQEAEACTKVLRDCVKRKLSLTPYMLNAALQAKQGVPLLRPMLLEFGETDEAVWESGVDTQYMLGPDLLVAPVFEEDGSVRFYVPNTDTKHCEGAKWRSWFDQKKTYEEGKWYKEKHSFDTLPILVRPGATILFNEKLSKPDSDFMDGLQMLINGPLNKDKRIDYVQHDNVNEVASLVTVNRDCKIEDDRIKVVKMHE